MDKLTLNALLAAADDIQVYLIETEDECVAMVGQVGFDEERLHDLFLDLNEGCWDHYLTSSWFPLASGDTSEEALRRLTDKLRTVSVVDVNDLVVIARDHSNCINDNFRSPLQESVQAEVEYANMLRDQALNPSR